MNESVKIFEESPMIGGYALAVRDDWSYKIKRVNVTEEEKNLEGEFTHLKAYFYKAILVPEN